MTLTPDQVPDVAQRVLAMREREQFRLERISAYMRGRHDSVYVPHGAKNEYRWLLRRSVVNFLPLVVSVISENLHVDGYLPTNPEGEVSDPAAAGSGVIASDPANPWSIFHANRMQARQHALHRAVVKYGIGYTVVLPGTMSAADGSTVPQPVIRPVSPRRLTALYADDVDDEWPVYAVEERLIRSDKGAVRMVWLYDDQNRYTLVGKEHDTKLYWPGQDDSLIAGLQGTPDAGPVIEAHDLGVCPVVRFLHDLDLDGEMDVSGEAEPLIPLQDQINTTTFNLLMAQQYAAFRQRWVTGMIPDDEDGRPREPFRSGVDRLWVAEDNDTKFGEFSETALNPILEAREASIRHMSTIAQVPPYHLLGQVANLPLALDTPVLTPLGRTMMGELKRGDEVFAPDGSVVKVKALSPVFHDHECYRVRFDDGTEIVADAQHRWETTHFVDPANPHGDRRLTVCPECGWLPGTGRAKALGPVTAPTRSVGIHRRKVHGVMPEPHKPGGVRETSIVTTGQIAESVRTHEGRYNHYIPLAKPYDGPEQDFIIDPYVLGAWLGDGERYKGYITSHKDDVEELSAHLRECGEFLNVRPYISGAKKSDCWTVCIVPDPGRCLRGHEWVPNRDGGCTECKLIRGRKDGSRCGGTTELPTRVNLAFRERLRLVGVWGDKHIPEWYFQGSFKQRLALLQGIMDTDGTVDYRRGSVAIGLADERLIRDVHRLICSVGHKAVLQDRREHTTNMGTGSRRWITWSALDPVFRLSRKAALQRTEFTRIGDGQQGYAGGAYGRYIAACDPVESVPVRCITVDSAEHKFCATDSLVTCENSAEALAASRDGLDRRVGELEAVLSEPWKQTLRLAGLAAGNKAAWEDTTSTVIWRDTSARAFAATADALGKVAQMLGVPATELWSRIPGVSAEEVARWKQVAESQGALAELNRMLETQMTKGADMNGPPTDAEPFQGPALGRPKGI